MQILQKGSAAGDATDSETGESGSSSRSVDDNGQNYGSAAAAAAVHPTGECLLPAHTKHGNINTNQTIINVSGIMVVVTHNIIGSSSVVHRIDFT